jgi:hypothetical protein
LPPIALRSASSAGIRASLSFHVFISAAKARSASSVERRLAAVDAPPRCPSPELAPAAVAPAASPPPAAAVAPTRPAAARWAPPSPRRCRAVVATSRYCAAVPPPHTTATAARHAADAATPPRRRFRHCASSSSYLWSRARGGAPWKEVLEGHHAVLVVRISIAIRISTLGVTVVVVSVVVFRVVSRARQIWHKGGGSRAGTAPKGAIKARRHR